MACTQTLYSLRMLNMSQDTTDAICSVFALEPLNSISLLLSKEPVGYFSSIQLPSAPLNQFQSASRRTLVFTALAGCIQRNVFSV